MDHAKRLGDPPREDETPASLTGGGQSVRLSRDMAARLKMQTAEVKTRASAMPRVLELMGSTALDPDSVTRIHGQDGFGPCDVIEIGKVKELEGDRVLRFGDKVARGQTLAVMSCAAVAQRKHDLFAAQIQLKLNQRILEKTEKAADVVPEAAGQCPPERGIETAVSDTQDRLRNSGVPESEIEAVRQEAREAAENGRPDTEQMRDKRLKQWARVVLRAPGDGTLIERKLQPRRSNHGRHAKPVPDGELRPPPRHRSR